MATRVLHAQHYDLAVPSTDCIPMIDDGDFRLENHRELLAGSRRAESESKVTSAMIVVPGPNDDLVVVRTHLHFFAPSSRQRPLLAFDRRIPERRT